MIPCAIHRKKKKKQLHIRIVDLSTGRDPKKICVCRIGACSVPINVVSKGPDFLGERIQHIYEGKGHTKRFGRVGGGKYKVVIKDGFTIQGMLIKMF